MLKFIANFFGSKKAPESTVPYKVEPPVDVPVVNSPKPVVNGRKQAPKKPTTTTAPGNSPAKKSSASKKATTPKNKK